MSASCVLKQIETPDSHALELSFDKHSKTPSKTLVTLVLIPHTPPQKYNPPGLYFCAPNEAPPERSGDHL